MTSRRAVLLSTAALIVICLTAFLITRSTQTGPDTATSSSSSVSSPTPAATSLPPPIPGPTSNSSEADDHDGDDHAEDPDVDNEQVWKPVVTSFGRNFTNTAGGNGPWRNRLIGDPDQPNVTTAVAKQLATVDVDNVPAGQYDSYQPLKTSTLDVAVRVDYTEGWSMVLYLNTDGTNWQIYAYDRYEE